MQYPSVEIQSWLVGRKHDEDQIGLLLDLFSRQVEILWGRLEEDISRCGRDGGSDPVGRPVQTGDVQIPRLGGRGARDGRGRSELRIWPAVEIEEIDLQIGDPVAETTIKTYLNEIRNRLDKAAGIGRAADACAGAGFHEKGLEVALDMEQLLYEATTLLNAASLINRIARQS